MKNEVNSKYIHTVDSKKFGKIGYVVIDRMIKDYNGFGSYGGVRVVPEMDLVELQYIARSMTYKNAFVGNRIGGAKAAIIVPREDIRKEVIEEFGKSISRLLLDKMYFPVMDMGITIEELQLIFNSAGYKCNCLSWKNLSHEYTAYSCFYSTLVALESRGISLKDVTFSVQGFGNVGSTYASLMYKNGARLTALSNINGGIEDENGFNVEELIKKKLLYGDNFILEKLKDSGTSHDSILEKDVTVLLLASNALVINEENLKNIKADIIICAANSPISHEIERSLFYDKKIVITDFVANCGGIIGSANIDKEIVLNMLSTLYKKKVSDILSDSIYLKKPFVDIVLKEIEERINNNYRDIRFTNGKTELIADALLNSPLKKLLNKFLFNVLSKRYKERYKELWR